MQITSLYGGPLEFIFVVDSTEDPAYHAVTCLLSDFKVNTVPCFDFVLRYNCLFFYSFFFELRNLLSFRCLYSVLCYNLFVPCANCFCNYNIKNCQLCFLGQLKFLLEFWVCANIIRLTSLHVNRMMLMQRL